HDDWRLPTIEELASILDYGTHSPTIDTTAFPGTPNSEFWTGSPHQTAENSAWYLNFQWGANYVVANNLDTPRYARCVRGATYHVSPPGRFVVSGAPGSEIVEDLATGLVWQKEHTTEQDWQAALAHCEGSGYAGLFDWRLPDINELRSLYDSTLADPASEFPGMPYDFGLKYWSSTTYVFPATDTGAFYVGPQDGYFYGGHKTNSTEAVRCVRGGP
ncbi:MAG: DUF1566 domain-containing protein, partial [Deltaproteobacteria bacterium]|nr:DUF1566 domain-containing protein [Deltaproteobacteria bacterium]